MNKIDPILELSDEELAALMAMLEEAEKPRCAKCGEPVGETGQPSPGCSSLSEWLEQQQATSCADQRKPPRCEG